MNRKLQHTMTALSATAAMLGLMLLAGAPPRPVEPDFAAFVASAAQDGALQQDGMDADTGTDPASVTRAGHARRARNAIALPYFSIAQGLRRATGS
ncbi:MAG: hypothetical protein ACTHOC_07460 [Luteimonas sp.]|jgi:hypothetical protein